MNASSNNSDVICPGQRFHLKCHTDSSFKGWYSSNDILFPLNDQQTTQNDSNYRAEYFPSRNLSILEVLHANKSFDVGCGSGPQNYTRNKFTVLQGKYTSSSLTQLVGRFGSKYHVVRGQTKYMFNSKRNRHFKNFRTNCTK